MSVAVPGPPPVKHVRQVDDLERPRSCGWRITVALTGMIIGSVMLA